MTLGLIILVNVLGFIPLIYLLISKNQINSSLKVLYPYLILVAFASFYELTGSLVFKVSVKYWFRIYLLLEFIVIYFFFKQVLNGKYGKLFVLFGLMYLILFLGLLFFWNSASISNLTADSYLSTLETIFVYVFSFLWFKDLFEKMTVSSLWNSSYFYFISGMILYFSGTLFLFLLGNLIHVNSHFSFKDFWMLNIIFNIIFRLILIVTVWKGRVK
ncbi:hypothetical protein FLJC2902T_12910 [Flavobacterium limnosediminis JC2902]|uniref:Uncharacterized protein n=1 Tax=Flavobacterium limnosediminis JC2902 TaxID=1341181 RepID=V6SWC3_9FLAO|nr:hypothetical protein [Flavobacterium limnosediminis]ESU28700.1 hypothetical protein FLJC2902T_12910 [Flavobacterium limnosediminis JC2902]